MGRKETLTVLAEEALRGETLKKLGKLRQRIESEKGFKEKPQGDPLKAALNNFSFIEERISPLVSEFFAKTKTILCFNGHSTRLGQVNEFAIFFKPLNSIEYSKDGLIFFSPSRDPEKLTPEKLQELWRGRCRKSTCVKVLARMTRDEILGKFERHVLIN